MQSEGLIAIGRLTKPHGLRGELVFLPYVYDLELLPDLMQRPCLPAARARPCAAAHLYRVAGGAQACTRTVAGLRGSHHC